MQIGAHVSVAGGIDQAVGRQRDVGGNCGQIFTHSPQVWEDPAIDEEEATTFREETRERLEGPWIIHASYLVNLATPKPELREKSIRSLQGEVNAAAALGVEYVNVHLGAHTGAGVESGLANAASALDELAIPNGVQVLVESDAGSGTKLGGDFAELAAVLDRSEQDLGACFDTAHAFAAGYDLSSPQAVDAAVRALDRAIGLDRLRCLHLNDSKHQIGTHKDEHAHLGDGTIGLAGIRRLLNHPRLRDLPFVLETPTEDGRSFTWNIETARDLRRD